MGILPDHKEASVLFIPHPTVFHEADTVGLQLFSQVFSNLLSGIKIQTVVGSMPIRLAQARLIQQDSYVPTHLRKSPCIGQCLQLGGMSHRIRSRWRAQAVSSGKRC